MIDSVSSPLRGADAQVSWDKTYQSVVRVDTPSLLPQQRQQQPQELECAPSSPCAQPSTTLSPEPSAPRPVLPPGPGSTAHTIAPSETVPSTETECIPRSPPSPGPGTLSGASAPCPVHSPGPGSKASSPTPRVHPTWLPTPSSTSGWQAPVQHHQGSPPQWPPPVLYPAAPAFMMPPPYPLVSVAVVPIHPQQFVPQPSWPGFVYVAMRPGEPMVPAYPLPLAPVQATTPMPPPSSPAPGCQCSVPPSSMPAAEQPSSSLGPVVSVTEPPPPPSTPVPVAASTPVFEHDSVSESAFNAHTSTELRQSSPRRQQRATQPSSRHRGRIAHTARECTCAASPRGRQRCHEASQDQTRVSYKDPGSLVRKWILQDEPNLG